MTILLPLVIFIDKTETNEGDRYQLEPLIFTENIQTNSGYTLEPLILTVPLPATKNGTSLEDAEGPQNNQHTK